MAYVSQMPDPLEPPFHPRVATEARRAAEAVEALEGVEEAGRALDAEERDVPVPVEPAEEAKAILTDRQERRARLAVARESATRKLRRARAALEAARGLVLARSGS